MSRTLRLLAPVRQQAVATSISVKKARRRQSAATAGPSSSATSLRHAPQNSPIPNSTARTASATACTATSASRLMRMQLWPMDTLPSSSVGVVIVGQQLLQLGGVPLGQLWAPVVQRRRVLEQHDPPTAGMLLGDERLHGVDGCIQRALARRHHPDPGPEYDGASPERPQGAHLGDVRGGGVISEDRGQVVKDLRAGRLATVCLLYTSPSPR